MSDTQASASNWSSVVEQIAAGSEPAVEELYNSLRSIRFFFRRQIGPDLANEAYRTLIVELVGDIKMGNLREPGTLPAYAMTVARRKVSLHLVGATRERRPLNVRKLVPPSKVFETPETLLLSSERQAIAKRVLGSLPSRHRETLIRFYLQEESREQIRAAAGLSLTQFRLIKSQAKSKYAELVQTAMNPAPN